MNATVNIAEQIEELIGLADDLRTAGRVEQAEDILASLERLEPAEPAVRKALAVAIEAFCDRLLRAKDYAGALEAANRALALQPGLAVALNNRGNALNGLGRHKEAHAAFSAALVRLPMDPAIRANLATALQGMGKLSDALAQLDRAIWLDPTFPATHLNRGHVLRDMGRHDEALESYRRATALEPAMAEAHASRANLLADLQRNREALDAYDAVLAIQPDNAKMRVNRGYSRLLLGDFEGGWRDYEARRAIPENLGPSRALSAPLWLGEEPLQGRAILLHCEQGMGDAIQFVRYVRAVAALGVVVVLEAFEALADLFRTVDGVAQVITRRDPLPAIDFHCPLMSLPLALSAAGGSAPASAPYLGVDPALADFWRERFPGRLKVGLAVSGNPANGNDRRRSIPLAAIAQALPTGPSYVLIQKDIRDDDRAALSARPDIAFPGPELASFADAAALCRGMDLVISVDTSLGHLAGALARPAWILLSQPWDWRWRIEGERSDWYPTARLYRQDQRGDWTGTLDRIGRDLGDLVGG